MNVGEICNRIYSGGTPKSSKTEYYKNGNIPWLNTKEVNFNRIHKTETLITEEGFSNSSAKWVRPHSVIVAMYGATAGKAALAEIPLTTNQACCNLDIDESAADYRYVYYWFKNNYNHIASLANGGAQQNLSIKLIRQIQIDLPNLQRQHIIAYLLSTLDDLIDTNAKINDYFAERD